VASLTHIIVIIIHQPVMIDRSPASPSHPAAAAAVAAAGPH